MANMEQDPIDKKFDDCYANAGVINEITACSKLAADAWEAERGKAFSEVMKGKEENEHEAHALAEAKWKDFLAAQLDAVGTTFSKSGKAAEELMTQAERKELTKQRTLYLRQRIDAIGD